MKQKLVLHKIQKVAEVSMSVLIKILCLRFERFNLEFPLKSSISCSNVCIECFCEEFDRKLIKIILNYYHRTFFLNFKSTKLLCDRSAKLKSSLGGTVLPYNPFIGTVIPKLTRTYEPQSENSNGCAHVEHVAYDKAHEIRHHYHEKARTSVNK